MLVARTNVVVFDAHTHFFSRAFYVAQAQQARLPDVPKLLDKMQRYGIDVPGEDHAAHCERIISELDAHGVDRAVTFASVPTELEIVGQAAAASRGRLIPYAIVNPLAPATVEQLERVQGQYNFRGMLLFPAMHDYAIGDASVAPALDLAARHNMITFVHCGLLKVPVRSLLGLDPEFSLEHGHPLDLVPVAEARPEQTFVVPHFGAGFFDEFLRLGKSCANVYADTAGSNTWGLFQAPELSLTEMFTATAEYFGVERILFGSDTAGFPRGYRADILQAQQNAMEAAGFSADDKAAVLGNNLTILMEGQ